MPRIVLGARNITTRNDLCSHIPYSLGSSFKILSAILRVKPNHVISLYKVAYCLHRKIYERRKYVSLKFKIEKGKEE